MKRFNFGRYGDEDYDDENEDEFEGSNSDEKAENLAESQMLALQMDQNILLEQEINQKVLTDTIGICKSSLFWRFRSLDSKLRLIAKTYKEIKKILES